MEQETQLRELPDIKELLEVLEQNGLEKEQNEVESLVDCLESMENQFKEVMSELKEVRGQLTQIQDRGIRAATAKVLDGAESKVKEIGGQIKLVKENLVRAAKKAVREFKEKGVDALKKIISGMRIPGALSLIQRGLESGKNTMNRSAEKISVIREELHEAGEHTRNVGRLLLGRERKEPEKKAADRGVLVVIQKLYSSCGRLFSEMEKNTGRTVKKMEDFLKGEEPSGQERPSVKIELGRLKKNPAARQTPQPVVGDRTR